MPNKDALLITDVIEQVVLVLPASPQSEHVVIGIYGSLNSGVIDFRVLQGSRHEHVRWDIVGATHEDWNTIQSQEE